MSTTATAEPTAVRLLDAAEHLIAERGIETVSLRAINTAAGSNVAAAHYHFGSKEALVAAVLQRRMGVLGAERIALLEPLEREACPSLRQVVDALARPIFRLADSDEGRVYVRFLAQLERAGDRWWGLVADGFSPQWVHLEPLLARTLPALSDDARRFRMAIASTVLLTVLGDPTRYVPNGSASLAGTHLFDGIVDVLIGILAGPADRQGEEQ
jgi:AcrR family transcriptional regulator